MDLVSLKTEDCTLLVLAMFWQHQLHVWTSNTPAVRSMYTREKP